MSFLRTILIQSRAVARTITIPAATRTMHTAPICTHSPRGVHNNTSNGAYDYQSDHSTPITVLTDALYVVSPVQGEDYQVPRGAFSATAPYITPEVNNSNAKPRFRSKISAFAHPLSGKN